MKRVRVRILGRVQGVFFRYNTRKIAERLGIKGWVRNCKDGSVEAVFPEILLSQSLRICREQNFPIKHIILAPFYLRSLASLRQAALFCNFCLSNQLHLNGKLFHTSMFQNY